MLKQVIQPCNEDWVQYALPVTEGAGIMPSEMNTFLAAVRTHLWKEIITQPF